MKQNTYLETKPRYEILDGLRGVAAVMVVIFHLMETYSKGPAYQIINHGYLGVDFFFALSGFVIGYAYDDRWNKMTLGGFFKRRLVRLHPMLIAGSLMGIMLYFLSESPVFSAIGNVEGWKIAVAFILTLFMIPCGNGLDVRGWGEMNPFNGPQWTLTYEYVGNILYALVFRHLPKAVLAILMAVCAFCTLDLCLNLNVFGLLTPARDAQIYTVIGGWSLAPEQIYIGFTRLLYPFLAGLMISRIGKTIKVKNGFLWCSLMIVAILALPCVGGEGSILNGIYNALCILILFPLVVMMGAGSQINSPRGKRVCSFLGEISYPLYITHYPIMYLQMAWAWGHPEAPLYAHIVVSVSCFLLAIGAAYAFSRLYDIPVREWLTNHWLKRSKKSNA